MKKPSVFSREYYLEELAARAAEPPIGEKQTFIEILREYGQREYSDIAFGTSSSVKKAFTTNKTIYPHNAFDDLFYEMCFFEYKGSDEDAPHAEASAKKYDLSKPIVSIYDFTHDKMLVARHDDATSIATVPISLSAKKRLFNDYGLNAFAKMPIDTIDDLMNQVPSNPSILAHGDNYEPKNNHQRERTKWLHDYVDTMFCVQASDVRNSYATPIFDNPHLICVKQTRYGEQESHTLIIGDLRSGHVLDVYSNYYMGPINGMREYYVSERSMTDNERIRTTNALFIIDKSGITAHDNDHLMLSSLDLNDHDLRQKINANPQIVYNLI